MTHFHSFLPISHVRGQELPPHIGNISENYDIKHHTVWHENFEFYGFRLLVLLQRCQVGLIP